MGEPMRSQDVERQSIHDRSVIDHLVSVFPLAGVRGSLAPKVIRSPALYHSIRRTWTAERHHRLLCQARNIGD
ncbi:MAG TPA: hypothetical protein VGU20_14890 [Stellaceae bacterium]|nr:hypothetical protein [Stellaceae bacterium]